MRGKDGKDGKALRARQAVRSAFVRAVVFVTILPALPVFPVRPALSQTDPRLLDAVRNAQEGRSDSARIKVRRLLAATSPSDTLYPQIIYTQAMVASEANEMRRQLQRVAVEYSSSSWADDALLRLVQLDYASGNLEGSARNLERIRLDYPGSSLLPQAAYWAARTYFDQKNPELACRWLADGLAASRGNIEMQNQLGYLDQRCVATRAAVAARPPVDSQPTVATAAPDTVRVPAPGQGAAPAPPAVAAAPPPPAADPAPTPANPAPPPGPPPAAVRPDSVRAAPPVAPQPPARGGRFSIQVSAVRNARAAEANAGRIRARGLDARVVEEGGLYKVRVGSYATRPEAIAALPTIKAQLGGSPFVVAEP